MKIPSPVSTKTKVTSQILAPLRDGSPSPRAFGAETVQQPNGLGQALASLGGAIGAFGERAEAKQRTRTLASMDTMQTDLNMELSQLQRQTPSDEANYYEIASGVIDNSITSWMKNNVPANLQDEFKARAENIRSQARQSSYDFGLKQEDAWFSQTVKDAETKATNGFMSGGWTRDQARTFMAERIAATGLSEIDKATMLMQSELKFAQLDYGKAIEAEVRYGNTDAASVIKAFEGLELRAYADSKASDGSFAGYRVGYGSDIVVREGGVVEKVGPNTVISQTDAERTLQYRITNEFEPTVRKQVGREVWNSLPNGTRSALLSVTWNYGELPDSVVAAVKTGDKVAMADAVAALDANPGRRQKEAAIIRGSTGAYQRAEYGTVPAQKDAQGYWTAPNVRYDLKGKTRDRPVSQGYVQTIGGVLRNIDPNLVAVITSGGQDQKGHGDKRTGSTRHDVDSGGESETSDLVLVLNGKTVLPGQNKALYARVMEEMAAAGFTGIGHYSWGIHVGGGSRAYWGPSTDSGDVDPEFRDAITRGWARAEQGVDGDPRFAMVPWEDRQAMQQQAETKVAREQAEEAAARKQQNESMMNSMLVGIRAGTVSPLDIDNAISGGRVTDYSDMVKLDEAMKKYQGDVANAATYSGHLASPNYIFDPTSDADRKGLNAVVGDAGKEKIINLDEEYFTNFVAPMAKRAGDIPTDVTGLLQGMARSSDPKKMAYAMDALSILQEQAPDAYAARVPATLQSDVRYYNDRKDKMTQEDLTRQLSGGLTPQERAARQALREEGVKILNDSKSDYAMSVPDLISQFDPGTLYSEPTMGSEPWRARGITNDYRTFFVDAYERTGDPDYAKNAAIEGLKKQWGNQETGGVRQLMKYPPQLVGYPPVNNYEYISKDVRSTLGLSPDSTYELISDDRTRQEFAAWQKNPNAPMPSYNIMVTDADGVAHLATTPDGKPARMNFRVTEEDKIAQEKDFDAMQELEMAKQAHAAYSAARQHALLTGTPIPEEIQAEGEEAIQRIDRVRKDYPDFWSKLGTSVFNTFRNYTSPQGEMNVSEMGGTIRSILSDLKQEFENGRVRFNRDRQAPSTEFNPLPRGLAGKPQDMKPPAEEGDDLETPVMPKAKATIDDLLKTLGEGEPKMRLNKYRLAPWK